MRFIVSTIVFSLFLNLGFAGKVFANETKVSISNNDGNAKSNVSVKTNTGENTICVNGKCTISSNDSEGKSTVCVNGKCYTSDDGNINVKSEDGNTTVNIENSEKNASDSSIMPKPTIEKKMQDKKASIEARKKEFKEELKEKHFDIGQIVRGFSRFILSWIF